MIRTACVTGADRGVGFSLVRALLMDGYTVFAGRYCSDYDFLELLKEEFPKTLYIIELDIGSDLSISEANKIIQTHTDHLDIIVNNAAVLGDIKATIFDSINVKEIQEVFNINTLGALRVCQALLPLLLKGERKLIANISSEAGSIGTCERNSWFAYCLSKSALNMQSQLIHNGIKGLGGQVLIIHPGHVQTYMQGELDTEGSLTSEQSASHIMNLLLRSEDFQGEDAVFVDYAGQPLPW